MNLTISEWMILGNVLEQHSSFFFSVWKQELYISCKKTDIARTICLLLKSNILMETTSVTAEYAAQWQHTGTGRCTQSYELHPAAEMMQDPGFSENANTKPDNMIKCKCWPTVNSQCS